jgi:hypothetical protein
MKLTYSVVEKGLQRQFFPDQAAVERRLEDLCSVCRLGEPPQGWPKHPYEEQIDEEDLRGTVERLAKDGLDALGLYQHNQPQDEPAAIDITVFISRCVKVAEHLRLNSYHVIDVVLIHEAAHYLTHLGVAPPEYDPHWPQFGGEKKSCCFGIKLSPKRAIVEDFAQSATYIYLRAEGDLSKLHRINPESN